MRRAIQRRCDEDWDGLTDFSFQFQDFQIFKRNAWSRPIKSIRSSFDTPSPNDAIG